MRILGTSSPFFVLIYAFILLGFVIVVVSPITEKEILLQFKSNISSDPFHNLISWDLNKNPCQDYRGVLCDSNGHVVKILLWNSSLGGVLSPALSGLKFLRIITLFGNRFTGNIPFEYGEINTLWKMNLSSNALSGPVPEFLGDLPNIRFLDLSRNGFGGEIPWVLFKNCHKTKFVSLARNNLSGPIPISVGRCSNLEGIDLSFNGLTGTLPLEVCDVPRMTYVSVRSNMLSGSVQNQVSKCTSLELLDLGSNMFSGPGPFEVLGSANLSYFNISRNKFRGEIPYTITCTGKLQVFDVSGNDFYGVIPPSITKCIGLKYLDLSFNRLIGSIPVGLSGIKNLLVVRLANNSIDGIIPEELGSIEWLEVLDLQNLVLGGEIPHDITRCRFLLELDVSGNFLEGVIPNNLDNMTYLKILDLHSNRLNGSIPSTIGNLSNLHSLDLSENSLSGSIPSTLGALKNLTSFNVSYNDLSGVIPSIREIRQFGYSAFFHNPDLCGAPLDSNACSTGASTSAPRKTKLSASAIAAIVAAALIVSGVCVITVINAKARKIRREVETAIVESTPPLLSTGSNVIIGKLVLFSKNLPSRYEDWETGTKALLDKECLIGGGSIGSVYKTTFEGGVSIAVKKLETLGRIRNQDEFEHEIGRLGNLRHPNLVSVQGYYWSSSMQLILSEFVPKGNLYDNLHGLGYPGTSTGCGNPELNWSRRFRISVGIARALAYLHHDCVPEILHLNIKSTNVLLDENYDAKLSDFGLKKLLPLSNSYGFAKIHNAVGYIAPELARSSRASDKCDVYSFGVILLELVTGRKPVERLEPNEVMILGDYVRGVIKKGSASDCFDRKLGGFRENEVVQVLRLGLICTCETASRRPSMAEAVQVMESIRNGSESS